MSVRSQTPFTTDPPTATAEVDGRPTPADFRSYQAPRGHGECLIDPPPSGIGDLLSRNESRCGQWDSFWGKLRGDARRRLVEDARRYTSAYRDVSWCDHIATDRLVMAGHQPELFHPGVWFKNFVLADLADRHGALAINLVVDNDVARSRSIRVPSVDPDHGLIRRESIAYDHGSAGIPYEQTTIWDLACFDTFDTRVRQAVRRLVDAPCVTELWRHAREAIGRCGVAGCALAQARHGLEGEVGLRTLELPLAVVARGPEYSRFLIRILAELPRFHGCYNDAAGVYRRVHGIRSAAHPVPNLGRDDEWLEAPLWLYGNESPVRRGVWVRRRGQRLVLTDRDRRSLEIELGDEATAAEQLADAASPQFKLRPRALLTTMYARLVLSDLFVHGIGGAKYDQLGDMIIRAFFGLEPPEFLVTSATVLLPGARDEGGGTDVAELRRRLRDTRFHPEAFAGNSQLDEALLRRKRDLLSSIPPRGSRKAWHDEMTRVNTELSQHLEAVRRELRRRLAQARSEAASREVLASREHPFCLYPLDELVETFSAMLPAAA